MMKAIIYIKVLLILVFFNSMCTYAQDYPFVDWTYQTFGTENNLGHQPTAMTIDENFIYVSGGFFGDIDFDPNPETQYIINAAEDGNGFVAKYSIGGELVWVFILDVAPRAIDVDESGKIYISGYFNDTMDFDPGIGAAILIAVSSDFFIAKYNSDGEYEWVIKGEPFGNSYTDVQDLVVSSINNRLTISGKYFGQMDIDPDPENEYLLPILGSNEPHAFYATYSLEGEFLWAHYFSVANVNDFYRRYKVDYDEQGSLFVSGHFADTLQLDPLGNINPIISWSSEYFEQDGFLAKYNQQGELEWLVTVQSEDDIFLADIAASDKTVSITGRVHNQARFYANNYLDSIDVGTNSNLSHPILASFDNQNGVLNFAFGLGTKPLSYGSGFHVAIDKEENIYFSGGFGGVEPLDFDPSENEFSISLVDSNSDPFVAKYSPSGSFLWAFSMPNAQYIFNHGLAVSSHKEVVITGTFRGPLDVSGYGEAQTLVPASEFVSTLNPLMYIVKYNQLDTTVYSEDESIILFPNPSSENHTLQLTGYENQKAVIDMYDIQGRIVKRVFDGKLTAKEEVMVDLSQLRSGMYLYTISTPSEQTSIRFIKE